MPEKLIWSAVLDNKYDVIVTRTGTPYQARLQIMGSGEQIHEEVVPLSFDAAYGPDVADVADWKKIGINVIDGRQNEKE